MATDGVVAFWNTNELLSQTLPHAVLPWSTQIHKIGINSCDLILVDGVLVLVTGCDDASMGVNAFDFNLNESPSVIASWYDYKYHTCQITGTIILEIYFYSYAKILTIVIKQI